MVIDYYSLGKRIAAIRKKRNLTQEKLAEMTDLANNYISNIETGRSIPSLETIIKLCESLDVTPDEMLVGTSVRQENYIADATYEKLKKLDPRDRRIVDGVIDVLEKEARRGRR